MQKNVYQTLRNRNPVLAEWVPGNPFLKSLRKDAGLAQNAKPVSFVEAKPNITREPSVSLSPRDKPKFLRLQLDERFPDAYSIIAYMDEITIQYGQSPYIRQFVEKNIICGLSKDNDQIKHIERIVKAARQWITYVADPVASELFISPIQMIQSMLRGVKPIGDCDDHVIFANSCFNSIGIKCRASGVHLHTQKMFDHVISSVFYKGEWIDFDLCAKNNQNPFYGEKLISKR